MMKLATAVGAPVIRRNGRQYAAFPRLTLRDLGELAAHLNQERRLQRAWYEVILMNLKVPASIRVLCMVDLLASPLLREVAQFVETASGAVATVMMSNGRGVERRMTGELDDLGGLPEFVELAAEVAGLSGYAGSSGPTRSTQLRRRAYFREPDWMACLTGLRFHLGIDPRALTWREFCGSLDRLNALLPAQNRDRHQANLEQVRRARSEPE